MLRKILLAILAICLLIVLGIAIAVPNRLIGVDLPQPSGSYAVGRASYDLVDPSRKEIFGGDPNVLREIVVTIYYPAVPPPGAKPAPYVSGKMASLLAAKIHLPAFAFQLIHAHAYEQVPAAEGKFPVVLFSPGIGTPPMEYTSSVEDLASHGYVVAEIYHTYSVPVTVFTDGRVATISDAGFRSEIEPDGTSATQVNKDRNQIGSVWVGDARFTLDQLTRLNSSDSLLKDHLNLDEVGMYGHSFGGATTAEVLARDPRFKAGINMDGTAFSMTDSSRIAQPFLWMAADYAHISDSQLKQANMTRDEFNAKLQQRNDQRAAFLASLPSGYLFSLQGSTHSTYITDEALLGPFVPGLKDPLATIDGKQAVQAINAYVLAFFDQTLKQKASPLLDGNSANFPEVHLSAVGK